MSVTSPSLFLLGIEASSGCSQGPHIARDSLWISSSFMIGRLLPLGLWTAAGPLFFLFLSCSLLGRKVAGGGGRAPRPFEHVAAENVNKRLSLLAVSSHLHEDRGMRGAGSSPGVLWLVPWFELIIFFGCMGFMRGEVFGEVRWRASWDRGVLRFTGYFRKFWRKLCLADRVDILNPLM